MGVAWGGKDLVAKLTIATGLAMQIVKLLLQTTGLLA
jgi:hypothetical protein